jgi:hypothetical protein
LREQALLLYEVLYSGAEKRYASAQQVMGVTEQRVTGAMGWLAMGVRETKVGLNSVGAEELGEGERVH